MKQFSTACDQNRDPILKVIVDVFSHTQTLLEIGSGTGQHAVYFAKQLPHLVWQPSDMADNHSSINAWRDEAGLDNLNPPLDLNVYTSTWPEQHYGGIFSANTTHIMGWDAVVLMFTGIGKTMSYNGLCCLYGPFNYGGDYTSDSNRQFDAWLKERDPSSGIRDFEDINALALKNDLSLIADHSMPANNRLLVWKKIAVYNSDQ